MFEFEKILCKQVLEILNNENSFKPINVVHKVVFKINEKTFIRQYTDENMGVKSVIKKCYRECILPIEDKFKKKDFVEWQVKSSWEIVFKLPTDIVQITKKFWKSQDYLTNIFIDSMDHPKWMINDEGKVLCGYRENKNKCGFVNKTGRWTIIDLDTNGVEFSSMHGISELKTLKKIRLEYCGKFQIKQAG